jgi:hypothetical protein
MTWEAKHRIMVPEPPEKKMNYRQEAQDIRAKARKTRDAEARAQLLLIASLYDKVADHLLVALQPKTSDKALPEHPTE